MDKNPKHIAKHIASTTDRIKPLEGVGVVLLSLVVLLILLWLIMIVVRLIFAVRLG